VSAAWQLPAELAAMGPRVIGATGGSGTRVLAGIVRAGGLFTGTRLNDYEDAIDFGAYSDRWINPWVSADGLLDDSQREAMADDLANVVTSHCADLPPDARGWGWKEPRSIYLMKYYDEAMPTFRFVHFLRDGRDMAFSENQNQLRKHGIVVLDADQENVDRPLQSIAVWAKVNTWAADYGEQVLGDRYLQVRFEDLCSDPAGTARRVYDFFELEGDAEGLAESAVRPPSTLGRWRDENSETVRGLHDVAGPALARFGYV
jgi:Sulfotransferase family